MKKSIIFLSLFFFALSLFADEPTIKFYLEDGNFKQFKIDDIENFKFVYSEENFVLNLCHKDSLVEFYSTKSIDSMKIEYDSNNVRYLSIFIFGIPKSHLISDIDSINFAILETKIADDAVVVDSSESEYITTLDSNKIVFDQGSSVGNNLKVGDIIASEPTELAPDGYLKRITSIKQVGDSIVVETEDAVLTDVIENGIISFNRKFTPADTGKITVKPDEKILSDEGFTLGFKDVVIYDHDKNKQTKYDQIKIDGSITYKPELGFNLVIEKKKVKQVIVQLITENNLSLEAHADLEYEVIKYKESLNEILNIPKVKLPSIKICIPIPIPPFCFPVVVTSNIDVQVGCDLSIGAEVKSGITLEGKTTAGIEYNNGKWSSIKSGNAQFTFNPPELSLGGKLKPFVGPQLNVNFYGLQNAFNAYANVFGFAELEIDVLNKPLWQLWAGVEGNAGIESEWFDLHKELPIVLEYRKLLSQSKNLIDNIEPNEGIPGEMITITGDGFGNFQDKSFIGFKQSESLLDVSKSTVYPNWKDKEIQAIIPYGLSFGDAELFVNINGFYCNPEDFIIKELPKPVIENISPLSAAIGQEIIITGTNFSSHRGTSYVSFNSATATTYNDWTDTGIKIIVPSGAKTGKIFVVVNGQKSNEFDFTVLPHIESISPDWLKTGDEITISGSNFGSTPNSSYVEFEKVKPQPQDYINWSNNEIKVKAPVGVKKGSLYVNVSGNKSNGYAYYLLPVISSITPQASYRGDEITISGTNFGTNDVKSYIAFNSATVTSTKDNWNDNTIKVLVPQTANSGKISVFVKGHKSNETDFTIIGSPTITSINPVSAKIGDTITITGTDFGSARGTNFVSFGSTKVVDYINWSDIQIKVKVPSGTITSKLSVTVKNLKSNELDFTVLPYILSISPTSGQIGSTVTIAGTGFGVSRGTNYVKFNTTQAISSDYTSWSSTQIVVKVPTGASSGKLSVTVGSNKSNEKDFTVNSSNPNEVAIGTQVWMTKNLDVDHYRNGDPIPQVTDTEEWESLTTGAWCYYDNNSSNNATYGKLYNWYAVNDSRGLAPSGWHVPSNDEWTTLTNYLGGESVAGGKMKETGTTHWFSPNSAATNESGFSALPGGYIYGGFGDFSFDGIGRYSDWWSSSMYGAEDAWFCEVYYNDAYFGRDIWPKGVGFSVRCVKD